MMMNPVGNFSVSVLIIGPNEISNKEAYICICDVDAQIKPMRVTQPLKVCTQSILPPYLFNTILGRRTKTLDLFCPFPS
jgi:hypothetical protein